MALDVSRYLAWESIIYPDGGTCVPGQPCAPEAKAPARSLQRQNARRTVRARD